jgi:uncharacterized protein YgiM (DUF1202 family)
MRFIRLSNLILSVCACLCCLSCATAQKPAESGLFYSIPPVTYLRDCPNYDCQAVAEIYSTDELIVLERNDQGWWRVESQRDQKTGWTQRDLLSKSPVRAQHYYITPHAVPLRDAPGQDVTSRKMLMHGDKVQKIAEQNGWWRVLVEKDKSLGWVSAKTVSATPPGEQIRDQEEGKDADKAAESAVQAPTARPAYLYVAAASLNLHVLPLLSSQVVKVLKINDKVEKISQAGSQWLKVRYSDTGAEGWAPAQYLKDSPVTAKTHIIPERGRSPKKAPSPTQVSPDPFKSEDLEPEAM